MRVYRLTTRLQMNIEEVLVNQISNYFQLFVNKYYLHKTSLIATIRELLQLLTGLDTRVGRLEKQLEMALNSIYTLVQLQTGINSSVTRFREEACEQLKTVKAMLSESSV